MSQEVRYLPVKSSPKGILIFLLVIGLLIPLSASAEPVISSLSLTNSASGKVAQSSKNTYIQSGEIADLRGKALLRQRTDHWIHWSKKQGSFEDTDGWTWAGNCWTRDNWECWAQSEQQRDLDVLYDASVAILGKQSYRNHLHYTWQDWQHPKEDPGKGIFHPLTWWSAPDSDQYFYRYYVRYSGPTFKWTNNSFKQFYVHNLFNMNPCMWDQIPEGKGPSMYDIQGGTRIFVHLGKRMELEQWYCIEVMVKKVGSGLKLKFWLDGKPCDIYDENNNLITGLWYDSYRQSDGSLFFGPLELGTVNCQNWTPDQLPVDQSIWFDGFAMSPTRRIYPATLVEIGNRSDYKAAKKVTQKMLWMKDEEIEFKTDLKGLGDGPYYLWVTNNSGERSKPYLIGPGDLASPQLPEQEMATSSEETSGEPVIIGVEPVVEPTAPESTIVEVEPEPTNVVDSDTASDTVADLIKDFFLKSWMAHSDK